MATHLTVSIRAERKLVSIRAQWTRPCKSSSCLQPPPSWRWCTRWGGGPPGCCLSSHTQRREEWHLLSSLEEVHLETISLSRKGSTRCGDCCGKRVPLRLVWWRCSSSALPFPQTCLTDFVLPSELNSSNQSCMAQARTAIGGPIMAATPAPQPPAPRKGGEWGSAQSTSAPGLLLLPLGGNDGQRQPSHHNSEKGQSKLQLPVAHLHSPRTSTVAGEGAGPRRG